jgi:predicted SnoaL-like aldol condensation-catalyzing enzyme
LNDYVEQVRNAFLSQEAGDLEPARRLLGSDAMLNMPSFIPARRVQGFDGLVAVLAEMMARSDGGFASKFVDAIGAGTIVTTINEVNATRNGRSILYNTVWTFRFTDGVVAEAWLHPSLPSTEIVQFYGFTDGGKTDG